MEDPNVTAILDVIDCVGLDGAGLGGFNSVKTLQFFDFAHERGSQLNAALRSPRIRVLFLETGLAFFCGVLDLGFGFFLLLGTNDSVHPEVTAVLDQHLIAFQLGVAVLGFLGRFQVTPRVVLGGVALLRFGVIGGARGWELREAASFFLGPHPVLCCGHHARYKANGHPLFRGEFINVNEVAWGWRPVTPASGFCVIKILSHVITFFLRGGKFAISKYIVMPSNRTRVYPSCI